MSSSETEDVLKELNDYVSGETAFEYLAKYCITCGV